MSEQGHRKTRTGVVLSNKMDKTIVVVVERLVRHPKYKKFLRARKKYKAHDERNSCGVGDRVEIIETRPISREKRWAVRSVLKKAAV